MMGSLSRFPFSNNLIYQRDEVGRLATPLPTDTSEPLLYILRRVASDISDEELFGDPNWDRLTWQSKRALHRLATQYGRDASLMIRPMDWPDV